MTAPEDIPADPRALQDEGDGFLLPVHPGARLRDWLEEIGIAADALATAVALPAYQLRAILLGRRAIDRDAAQRLAVALGTTAEMWLDLQARYDLEMARRARPGADD